MMKIKSKRLFTLLEMLISLALTALILSTLFYFYHQVDQIGREMDRTEAQNFTLRFVEGRLANVLPKSSPDGFFFSGEETALFKPGTGNLLFTFDHGVHLDKRFSYIVLGRIFVTAEGLLTLALWPDPKSWQPGETPPMKQELLLAKVTELRFEFFVPPQKGHTQPSETIDPAHLGQYIPVWKQEYKQLPAIVRMRLKQEGSEEEIVFAFPLPNSPQPITYDIR